MKVQIALGSAKFMAARLTQRRREKAAERRKLQAEMDALKTRLVAELKAQDKANNITRFPDRHMERDYISRVMKMPEYRALHDRWEAVDNEWRDLARKNKKAIDERLGELGFKKVKRKD